MKRTSIILLALALTIIVALLGYSSYRHQKRDYALDTDEFLKSIHTEERQNSTGEDPKALLPGADSKQVFPKLELSRPELDVGLIKNNEPTVVEFPIFNRGKGDLVITDIQTSCRCTEGVMAPGQSVIKPGGQGILKVRIDPYRIPGFHSRKVLTIYCNEPTHVAVTLDVIARVDPEFSIEPEDLAFGDVPKGQSMTKTVEVRQVNDDPFEIDEVTFQEGGPSLAASFLKRPEAEWKTPGKAEYTISVTLPPDLPPGPCASYLFVKNTCKRVPSFGISIAANVKAFYTIEPLSVSPGTVQAGQSGLGAVTIRADRPFEISDLAVSGTDFTLSTSTAGQPNLTIISLNVVPTAGEGRKKEDITFTIKSGELSYRERIPVQATIPKSAS